MKNSVFLLLCFLIFTIQCKKEVETKTSVAPKIRAEKIFKVEAEKFYGVYQLNENDFAICIPVQMGNADQKEVDSLSIVYENFIVKDFIPWIYQKPMGKYSYYDTIHWNQIIYNADFEQVIRNRFQKTFTIFGLEEKKNCGIRKVVFQSSECGNDYVALILDLKNDELKNPVIASEKDFDLKFLNNPAADQKIKKIAGKEATENMYGRGNYHPKTFGRFGNYYFSYDDDFKWFGKKYEGGKQFPERLVAKIEKNNFKIFWVNELDLLGLPCL